jgi:two-component system cell cycle sensor histidine kinase/response regulator CckA
MASLPASSSSLSPARGAALIAGGCGLAAALIVLGVLRSLPVAAAFLATGVVVGGALIVARRLFPRNAGEAAEPDWSVARTLAAGSNDALAVTDRAGRLVCANDRYESLFGGFPTPPALPIGDADASALGGAGRAAWRDGVANVSRLVSRGTPLSVQVTRAGDAEDMLVWRFGGTQGLDLASDVEAMIAGAIGDRLASAGIMTALIASDGRIRAANRVLRVRAMGHEEGAIAGRDFARFLITDSHGQVRFEREGLGGTTLRVLQIPFLEGDGVPMLVALLDEEENETPAIGASITAHVRSLVSLMPFGMALVGDDGRFLQRRSIRHRRRSIRATSWCARTRPSSPMRSAALPAAPHIRPTLPCA